MSKKYNILIVDDSAAMRMMITASLQDSEFEVVGAAKDGHQALQLFKDTSPDLVLLDIVMPGMSGLETLGHIMALDKNAIVVMASSMGTEDAVQGALKAGAKNFLQKPIDQDGLLKVLRATVSSL
ncbi:MAG: response regulator [Gallionella sp.]